MNALKKWLSETLDNFVFEDNFTHEQQALADCMSDLSEYHYFAGWIFGCEIWLWNELEEINQNGHYVLSSEEKNRLIKAKNAANGWVVFLSDDDIAGLSLDKTGNYYLTIQQCNEYFNHYGE